MTAPLKPEYAVCRICKHAMDDHYLLAEETCKIPDGLLRYRIEDLSALGCLDCECVVWRHKG